MVKGLVVRRFGGNGALIDETARGAQVEGCFFGTYAGGIANLGINGAGVAIFAVDPVIGGTMPAARNLPSGNRIADVGLTGTATAPVTGVRVQSNLVDTDKSGAARPDNDVDSVFIVQKSDNGVDGNTAAPNVVAFHGKEGTEDPRRTPGQPWIEPDRSSGLHRDVRGDAPWFAR